MAWEPIYYDNLRINRHKEVHQLKKRKYLDALCVYFWATTPILVSLATFGMYTLLGHQLTAAKAFTSLSLFNILIRPLNAYPWVINGLIEGHVSATRVYDFLTSEDVQANPLIQNESFTTKSPKEVNSNIAVEIRGDFIFSKADEGSIHQMVSPQENIRTRKPAINTPHVSEWLRLDQEFASPSVPKLTTSPSAPGTAASLDSTRNSAAMDMTSTGANSSDFEKFTSNNGVNSSAEARSPFYLHSLSLQVKKGEFIGISGGVGQGKSSLLLAILGELWACNPMNKERSANTHFFPQSFSSIHGSVAYVAQEAWIQNATIRENVCFGHEFHSERYWEILHACALLDDLKQFPARDLTEVGEGGHSISGGQKIRLSLARAIYAGTDIILLDDPLSAVDVHVAHHIVKYALLGLLATKTRILVTHHAHAIRTTDRTVHMSKGCITHVTGGEKSFVEPVIQESFATTTLVDEVSDKSDMASLSADDTGATDENTNYVLDEIAKGRLTIEESRSRGTIRRRVLHSYFSFIGVPLAGLILLSLIAMQGTRNFNDWWVADWSEDITGQNYFFSAIIHIYYNIHIFLDLMFDTVAADVDSAQISLMITHSESFAYCMMIRFYYNANCFFCYVNNVVFT
jgi:ATP-binding cassette subfamily C (CFTR/MRP) protein 10